MANSEFKLSPDIKLGPVSLKVRDLGLMESFYERDVGLTVLHRDKSLIQFGAGSSKEPILELNEFPDSTKPPEDAAGLYHYALLVPDRKNLAATYLTLGNKGTVFDGFADHLVSEALYLTDPENNGIEIYRDRSRDEWRFDEEGYVDMTTQPLDIDSLLREVAGVPREDLRALADGTRVGHIHLKVTNLQRSIAFYRTMVGLELTRFWGNAAFLSTGRYHHHVGMNTWESLGGEPVKKDWTGLGHFTITIPNENLRELSQRMADSPLVYGQGTGQLLISDPDDIELVFKSR